MFKEVLEARRRILGREYVDTLIVMSHLASLYFEMERTTEAVSLDTALSEMRNNTVVPRHNSGVLVMRNLAAGSFGQGPYATTAELGPKAFEASQRSLWVRRPRDDQRHVQSLLCLSETAAI